MDRFLREMPTVPQGTPPARIVTPTRINAIQDAIRELAGRTGGGGDGVRLPADRTQRRPRYQVWFHAEAERLYVTEGRVGAANEAYPDMVVRPMEPTLEGTALGENPYFDVSDKATGEDYEVICIFDTTRSRVVLHRRSDELELNRCERAWLVATVKFRTVGEKIGVETLRQEWSSDIPWTFDEVSCDSSDGSSEDDSSDASSDDSSDDSDDSGDTSSDDSSDDSGDGSSECCPALTVGGFIVRVGVGTAECFTAAGIPEEVEVAVTGYVGEIPCEECEGQLWVEFGIGSQKASRYLGQRGGQSFGERFVFQGLACQEFTVWAQVKRFGSPVDQSCDQLEGCREEITYQLPAVCGEDCSSDDSSDGSGGDSGGSGDSSGSSGDSSGSSGDSSGSSDDPSSDKNCIVPLGDRHVALACVESPGTWFVDYLEWPVVVCGRVTRVELDPDFVAVCEPGSLRVVGAVPDRAAPVGARIEGRGTLVVETGWLVRAREVEVTIAGKRKGSLERFAVRTRAQYEKSRNFWKELNR
jgi:uncharacterized membrane protein YgcG